MSSERGRFVALPGASPVRAYVAEPAARDDLSLSVVVAMHLWGVDAEHRETAGRFADCGFTAIVPDLYARLGAPSGDGVSDPSVFLPFAKRLDPATVDLDLRAAAAWLRERDARTAAAIVGFCMGGVMALRRAAGWSSEFAAVAVWYGSIAMAAVNPAEVEIPVVASFGARDRGIPVDDVEAFASKLAVPHDVRIYPNAGHGFFDKRRSSYAADAAEHSWQRTIEFLRRRLAPAR